MAGKEAGDSVKSAVRTLRILETVVAQGRPMAAHEIATALAIPVSSLAYLLNTLIGLGYLHRDGRRYLPGEALARLNPEGVPDLAEMVGPLVRSIRDQLNETVGFFVARGFMIEAVASETGLHALRYTQEIGRPLPMHAFSAGKALLALFDEEGLSEYLAGAELSAFTPNTITDAGRLRAELDEIRRTGIARTREEYNQGIYSLGKAALRDGVALGAFSIAIPAARFDERLEAAGIELLDRAAELLGNGRQVGDAASN